MLYNLQAGCQKQSDCVRLAKYRQNTLPGILRLIMFTNISMLTGATLSRVPAYEQEDRERETRAESKSHLGFVGPISPPSSAGNRYILTVSDYFTKFAWAHALPTKEAVSVVAALRQVRFTFRRILYLGSLLTGLFYCH